MIHGRPVVSLVIGCVLSRCVLAGVLGRFLALTTLHLGLLEQSLLLRQSFPLLAILDLVLANESLGRVPKDALVLAEFADPDVLEAGRVVKVGILLLDFALTRGQSIDATRRPLLLPPRGCRLSSRNL